jgi:hypothetical protein
MVRAREVPVLVVVGAGIVIASVYAARSPSAIFVLGGVLIALAAYVALARFEAVTLVMLAVRTSIELIPIEPPIEVLRASVVVTAAYTVAAAVWLVRSSAEQRWRPSFLAWSVGGLAASAALSAALSADPLQAGLGAARWAFLAVFVLALERIVVIDRGAVRSGLGSRPLITTGRTRTGVSFVRRALLAMLLSAAVPLGVGAWQIATSPLEFISGEGRVSGALSHPNTFGFYLVVVILGALALLPSLQRAGRLGLVALVGLAAVELAVTYSRTSYVALAAGMAVLIVVGRRWALLAVGVALIALATLVPGVASRWDDLGQAVTLRGTPANTLTWRLDYWGDVLAASEERRVTGLGLGVVAETTEQQRQPHNDFVRALAELGIIGLLAYGAFLAALSGRSYSTLRATRDPARRNTTSRGLAEGCAAISSAFLVGSVTGNLMTQLVILWYVLGFAVIAGVALRHRPNSLLGREGG